MRSTDAKPILPSIRTFFVRTLEKEDPRNGIADHVHQGTQWYHCLHGQLQVEINGTPHLLNKNQGIIVPPGKKRGLHFRRKTLHYFTVICDLNGLRLDDISEDIFTLNGDRQRDTVALAQEGMRAGGRNRAMYISALVNRLLVELSRLEPAAVTKSEQVKAEILTQQAQDFIHYHMSQQITQEHIAEAFGCSVVHLARCFKQITGETLGNYLLQQRLQRAEYLLRASTMRIEDISAEVGFRSVSHFGKQFLRQVGMKPSEFRRYNQR